MIDYTPLLDTLKSTPLASWHTTLAEGLQARLAELQHGDLERWQQSLRNLPPLDGVQHDFSRGVKLTGAAALPDATRQQLHDALQGLHPWRKGPFDLFGVHIDTEWRSDWKWERVAPHIDLRGRRVLDIGCGNGYYMWRMWHAGAAMVIGVDPNLLFLNQFEAVKHYLPTAPVWQLPFTLEDLPEPTNAFDTVFSMGVFYHRRSPVDHLLQLKACLRPGGELVLETLVVEGDENHCLLPEDRYAQMRNVWFLPSVPMLERMLRRAGFRNVRCVDLNQTSMEEQRSTEWMRFNSLPSFLDPNDSSKTIEGYPAPLRATLIAERPA
ncbi:MAG: tRNA 5-methoxyuridine(34)/uridine 5-oxyacetic acid(34) synthase CmoB [Pseudomonadota bacterium]|uniref:tRNA 5-methoxyuridine(34)/uridine 5-oxyacetic acid(34) synthase CmoB n=1 Tax=Halopseudomonas TaxID=2901189 RepID=UPI000C98A774|nr:tRNA 5-methoxyuridine(34)/uridine 5-oxyacetic acid(34) synthase CmoB [Pseudomonadales bacterium]MAP78020.1 tRNA 5-methoxyuridine(34)/uridine 5-oxyacetic acid(34) synthase CmoB [Pseudomonadales bacterium]MEE2798309.1 tRNA 5-methoxyuridine(34)/uridine 5-oxyacetic acid(34) synthase CmoB [Pseudomonadota bacterium]HBT57496.1 tRNA 5-methoxyuridine(34)/uridine 5-oxyacetic acid(34) synthase CmoB [Pseudomonas sp.]HCP02959.1 tRNA 5-methoxyuridine(34)/uridine 5-oxyacetic acid(34) synthase CmoB [Pseudom